MKALKTQFIVITEPGINFVPPLWITSNYVFVDAFQLSENIKEALSATIPQ